MFLRWPQITLEAVSLMGGGFYGRSDITPGDPVKRIAAANHMPSHRTMVEERNSSLSKGPLEMEANVALPLSRIVSLRCVTEVDGRQFMSARGQPNFTAYG